MPGWKTRGGSFAPVSLTLCIAFLAWNSQGKSGTVKEQPKDQLPIVKITSPQNNSVHEWNTLVDYSVVITDHGKSTKYQEIPSNQVLVKTTYAPDLAKFIVNSDQMKKADPQGVMDIMNSNCLGCHSFKAMSTGPSFSAISEKYPHTQATIDALSQKIRDGSSGVWGQEAMPPHPELAEAELHAISSWIVNDAANPDVNYYVGPDGAFQMKSPGKPDTKGGIILTASYVSHGTKEHPEQASRGENSVVIPGK